MKRLTILACTVCLLTAGCVTKPFGQMKKVSDVERHDLTCQDINIEIDKVAAFREGVRRKAKVNFASVVGFLGDFGAGNAISRSVAESSSTRRLADLNTLKVEHGCAATSLTVAQGNVIDRKVDAALEKLPAKPPSP